jgi:uncharacterized protein YndB with AHSA1/START domain
MPPKRARSIRVERIVDAPVSQVFAFLADPANHVRLDTSGMMRSAANPSTITAMGDVFVMNMHNDFKGDHQVENHVVAYEPDRAIGWAPAEPGESPAGHTYVWELGPDGDRTIVSQTYDWSEFTHLDMLEHMPVVDERQLRASLDKLADALGASGQ